MTNDQMKPGRFLRWHRARRAAARISAHLSAGGRVVVGTYTRATVYTRRHADLFRATREGLYVRRGKGWDCIDHCAIRLV